MASLENYLRLLENPEALGKKEKELLKEIEPIIHELLDELKVNGKIETVFVPAKKKHMENIMNNVYQLEKNGNLLTDILKPSESSQDFLAVSSKIGFDKSKLTNLYIQLLVLSCVLYTEVFKSFLLYHLREVNPKVSNFPSTMEKAAPKAWKKLQPYVDNKFRNSLAHGTWALENKQVVLFEDAELIPYDKLNLAEFIIKMKKQNLLYTCLEKVVIEKTKAAFFT